MFIHPYIGSQLARERQREMPAQAGQQRLVGQLREHARASRSGAPAQPCSLMNHTAAASCHPSCGDPSWPH